MAQPNIFGVTEFDQDPETAAELRRLRKQQEMADAMMGNADKPLQGQMVGNVYVKPSITQGLAQLFSAYSAGKMRQGVDEGYQSLSDKRKAVEEAAMEKYRTGMTGTPDGQQMYAGGNNPDEESGMGFHAGIAPTKESKMNAIMEAIAGNNPRIARMAQMQFKMDSAEQARKDAAQARLDQINEAERQRRITKEEADVRRAEEAANARKENAANREAMLRLGASLRPAPQPVAPTMKDIVDPKDPTRMISVDAKTYRGGSIGDQGVLGIAGKEPVYAKRQEKEGQGVDLLKNEIDNMKMLYSELADKGGTPSTASGGLSNASAWVRSSAAGQLGGRILGTEEQKLRNEISSGKRRILSAIKNATGASAQEMNSNVELKTWMDSLGDPTQSVESNISILDAIENSYIKGKKVGTGRSTKGTIGTIGTNPSVDELLEKYK